MTLQQSDRNSVIQLEKNKKNLQNMCKNNGNIVFLTVYQKLTCQIMDHFLLFSP